MAWWQQHVRHVARNGVAILFIQGRAPAVSPPAKRKDT
jgi:hypothetical protein